MDEGEAGMISRQIRRRDAERFELEIAAGDARAGARLMYGNTLPATPRPTPFTRPRRGSRTLNPDAVPQAEEAEPSGRD
ncbi:potassium transporter KefB [Xanthomonas vasicola]|uniref:Potassium transporter KefB n=2 Tax=Xanthomonas vasicola TaxID=56459 RepID=A0A836P2S4_XANVA|nr:potassium transporter KefB [Xanthomonas vasicola]KEZ95321.1 potassium transporter KefB [Xanthomonas vasicola pv. vasculorum NCPPB 895]KFA27812.1 potassium transporter KefB [Xanthomonas vasicola pv. vasculorum NCPPB 1381]KFA31397.1 potassium transporter KefB [Xanthomonas vasicola pv. vasculorum NCPPB 1326]MBV6745755.1 potassium transporter KefB [Xanthomonas vasicola pv. vasculorum NCPPB 890]MBV6891945.1 potassium transporter KefB [Xanthomonas vasicola pv. vasculorum]HHZ21145.1 potassium tra